MTEDEAKTKWCPYAYSRVIEWKKSATEIYNVLAGEPPTTLCLASVCMAWRWTKIANPAWKSENPMISTFPRPNPYSETPAYILSTTDGRCGLAGQE